MVEAIVRDISHAVPASEIAAAFHNTLAALIVDVCEKFANARPSIACA